MSILQTSTTWRYNLVFIVLYTALQYLVYLNSQPCPHSHGHQMISLFDAHVCHFYFHSFFFFWHFNHQYYLFLLKFFPLSQSCFKHYCLIYNDFSNLIKNCSLLFSTHTTPYNTLFHLLNTGYLLLLLLV